MRRTHHLIASVSVCAVALGLPVCALAQTPGPQPSPADGDMVEEVVVTARGRLEQLKDVAVSASVIDGQALQAAVILNLQDFSTRVPNFRINTSGQSDYIVIRGMGSSANSGFEQSVATFVDGVYRSRSRSSRSTLFDIERVEVLRGPQTTFFGNNAIAGALNIVTRKPSGNFGGNASIYYGEYGEYSVEGGVNLPLTDTLSARVAARTTGMEGYIQNSRPGVGDGPMMQSFNGRFAVAWRPSDNTTVDARLDVGRTHDKNQALVELFNCPPVVGTPRGPCLRYATGVGASAVDDDLDYRTDLGPSLFDLKYEEAVITGKQVFDSFNLT